MMRWLLASVLLVVLGAVVACNIQPQPLPPGSPGIVGDDGKSGGFGEGAAPGRNSPDAGTTGLGDAGGAHDAGQPPPPAEGGSDAGGGDAGDGGSDAPLG